MKSIKLLFNSLVNKIYVFLFKKDELPKVKRKYTKKEKPQIFGEYGTIKTLLNDLDDVFSRIKKISKGKHTPQMQKLIRVYGPHVTNLKEGEDSGDGVYSDRLEGFKAYGLPSFLISYWNASNSTSDDIVQNFVTAIKTKRADFGQRIAGHVYYDVAITFIDEKMSDFYKGKPFSVGFCVSVNKKTGEVDSLPYQNTNITQVRYHDSSSKGASYHSIPAKVWQYPDIVSDGKRNYTQKELKDWGANQFCIHYGMVMKRESGINIIVKKGNRRATFNVPHNDWKYFFKDRIKAKTIKGNTKPIFHAVASHFREVNSGITTVKTHYRGIRHFIWSGYEIKIVMQGKHGLSSADFNIAGMDQEKPTNESSVPIEDVAGKVNKLLEG